VNCQVSTYLLKCIKRGENMVKLTLDVYLDNKGITRYQLAKDTGIKFQIIDNYYKNRVVRYDSDVIDRICRALGCNISDLIKYQE